MNKNATLIINRNDSKCFNCDEGAGPDQITHDQCFGYGEQPPGCGIKFENVSSEYGDEFKDMRPDLNYISYKELVGV